MGAFRLKLLPFLLTASLHAFNLVSPAFEQGGEIPADYGCIGSAISPELDWSNPPTDTVEFALVITDLTIDKVHGRLYNIPRESTQLAEGTVPYTPICPPKGETHTYEFALYALSKKIKYHREIEPNTISVAKLIGTYKTPTKENSTQP